MRILIARLVFLVLLFIPFQSFSQYVLNIGVGSSTFGLHPKSHDKVKREWARQGAIRAYRIGIEK